MALLKFTFSEEAPNVKKKFGDFVMFLWRSENIWTLDMIINSPRL